MKLKEFKKQLLKDPVVAREFEKYDLAFEISQMLIEARIIKGITQEKLAQMVNTKQTSIARAENGKLLPSLRFLKKIADALNTHLIAPRFAILDENVQYKSKNNNSMLSTKNINTTNITEHLLRQKSNSQEEFTYLY